MINKFAFIFIVIISGVGCSTYQGETLTNISSEGYSNSEKIYENLNIHDFMFNTDKLIKTDKKPCRIKYHTLYSTYRNIIVEGTFGTNTEKHPVILDTGASQPVVLNAKHVRKCNLPIYGIDGVNTNSNENQPGFCQLPKLSIGEVTLEGWPCIFFASNKKLNLFGIPIASSTYGMDNIILGLPLLREFKYITFDNINKEAELSYYQSFEPDSPEGWKKYPIFIEEDFHGNAFLFVRLIVEGYETELQLDTGSGRGLAASEVLWENINNGLRKLKLKKGKENYPYIGNLPCKKGKISNLEFGNRTINNAEIAVFKDDCPLLDGCDGLVGMQYFSNTVFVLDFENDLMWVKEQDNLK